MRDYREKEFDKYFMTTLTNNRSKMRQTSLNKLRTKYNIRPSATNSQYKTNNFEKSTAFITSPNPFYSKGAKGLLPK